MDELERYKIKKMSQAMSEMAEVTKNSGYIMAEACYTLAYKAREIDSRIKANQKEIELYRKIR